jgi:PAS domain S-box-containing protein
MSLENHDDAAAFTDEARRMAEVFAAGVGLALQQQIELETQHQREQRLSLLIKQTPLGFIEWDVQAKVIAWNPAAEAIFGYRAEEVVGQRTTAFIVPDWVKPHTDKIWAALVSNTGGQRSTNENVTKDGRIITCDWYNSSLVDESGKVIGVASLVQDISERKRTEEQLSQAIQEVLQDASWFTQLVMEKLARIKNGSQANDALTELTERERQVLELLSTGASNKKIGARLGLSAQTVRNYVSHIYSKLNLRSRAEAVVWARERGIIS